MPSTSHPRLIAERQAARMTAFRPGASPPPVEIAMRISASSALEQRHDFARLRVPAELRLLEDRLAVPGDLEASSAGRLEGDVRVGKFLLQLGRQTDGPWLVRSNGAGLDFYVYSPGMPARFASFLMTESCLATVTLRESICSCMSAMSCRCA